MHAVLKRVTIFFFILFLCWGSESLYASLKEEINENTVKLRGLMHKFATTNDLLETLYRIKGNFTGLTQEEEKKAVPPKYLKKSVDRAKQLGLERVDLQNLFYNLKLTGITKAEARDRVNGITEDVIKYRESLYQEIMIEKTRVEMKNLLFIAGAFENIRETSNDINDRLKRIEEKSR